MSEKTIFSLFRYGRIPLLLFGLAGFIGCSSSGADLQTGVFLDSPVAGLSYSTPNVSGTTDAAGKFNYYPYETVTFSVGGLTLGSAKGKAVVTPTDIVSGATGAGDQRVANMLVFLQTLDQDGDLNNGIQITPAIAAVVANYAAAINFNQTTSAFAADANVTALLEALNAANVFTDTDTRARTLRNAVAAQEHFARSTSERKVANTQYGQIKGFAANASTWQWLGIPYAKPPIGDLRWRPPQPPVAWTGVRDAVAWADQAAQGTAYQKYGEGGMSEDCLYLNVTAPKNASNLPVMVWFHGGGYQILSSNTKGYNNADGPTTKGVVLVTVNHRLNIFGYLAHPWLTAESTYGGSGNYGNMDLVMALTWVKNNIANFGGDPNSVTIFGQSGGGRKVWSMIMTPLARGLFHKAIIQSGSLRPDTRSLETAEAMGQALSAKLGVTTLAEMRAKNWTEVISAYPSTVPDPYPNVDNYYFPETERSIIEGNKQNDLPFMILVTKSDSAEPKSTLKNYLPLVADHTQSNVYATIFTKVPSGWAAQGVMPYHSVELSYVFNTPESAVGHYILNLVTDPATGKKLAVGDLNGNGVTGSAGDMEDILTSTGWDAADEAAADTVMTMWTNFAKTGNPSTANFTWPPYTSSNDTYVEIGATPVVKTGLSTVFP
ncbi:MAG: carboxylesterase family protein [Deltaproteobacteria bacterium]|nr:carboxylesterase family protein [Deltaproteobacteria bacterium]